MKSDKKAVLQFTFSNTKGVSHSDYEKDYLISMIQDDECERLIPKYKQVHQEVIDEVMANFGYENGDRLIIDLKWEE